MKKLLFIAASIILVNGINAQNYQVSTVGGNGTQGFVDGATTTIAELYWPYGVAYDGDSVIYFTDSENHAIRKLSANTHKVTTIAGTGVIGLQDGACSTAKFYNPDGIIYKNGFLYIGDNMNNCIRKIDLANNLVSTYAGTGTAGYLDGAASQAMFRGGNGIDIAIDKNNNIYVADGSNYCIRMISSTGQVTTFAGVAGSPGLVNGPASQAKFHRPRYLAIDTATGALYTTDINNNVIRKILNGVVSTFSGVGTAGATDGIATVAQFSAPVGISITANGNFYVIDGGGNKLRKVDANGTVSTIAGNGVFGFQDGPAASAEFYYPQGVCYDKHGFIYLADRDNNRIRKISVPECEDCAGIEQLSTKNQIAIYPNPSSGIITIQVLNAAENCIYKVYNTLGQEVKNGAITQTTSQLSLQELANGVYTVVVSQKDKISMAKIIVQK
jgi:sugar lactone lactonase YvrE